MKATIDLPDAVLRQAKKLAVARGVTLKHSVTNALEEQIRRSDKAKHSGNKQPPQMAGFGALSDLGDKHRRVLRIIEKEFERLEQEALA